MPDSTPNQQRLWLEKVNRILGKPDNHFSLTYTHGPRNQWLCELHEAQQASRVFQHPLQTVGDSIEHAFTQMQRQIAAQSSHAPIARDASANGIRAYQEGQIEIEALITTLRDNIAQADRRLENINGLTLKSATTGAT